MASYVGIGFALGAAVAHSFTDTLRKLGAKHLQNGEVVGFVSLLDCTFLSIYIVSQNGVAQAMETMADHKFFAVISFSAAIKITTGFMYQRALQVSPLSLTIPYLAFTPALLVFTSYLMLGESASPKGLLGVVIVTLGGYLLQVGNDDGKDRKTDRTRRRIQNRLNSKQSEDDKEVEEPVPIIVDVPPELSLDDNVRTDASSWKRILAPLTALSSEEGSMLMLGVAALWSLTSSFDKLGAELAPTFVVFAVCQRAAMCIPVNLYLLGSDFRCFRNFAAYFPLLTAISLMELATLLLYLKSLEYVLVSYAIAAKRSGIMLSVICGAVFFNETIMHRLPYIVLMLLGMVLILFADA
ncbi:hypothetical protein CYMTET_9293 [Cymbomonas tetramitiformis]|uniref:EamA domain-containing protein n=1 Tax=Cymbomonas tetramitiformis TaxID=36881 RepID=A0AAE0LFM7_9CHLO|nr:hypothetical protein CYMTET_9293 [Cymbomonas tetramitiformis]